jgi:hypothetical protein
MMIMAKPINKPFSTRLPDEVRAALRTLADSKGLSEADLGRMFIIEKLDEYRASVVLPKEFIRRCHAISIAALSEQLDYVEALK